MRKDNLILSLMFYCVFILVVGFCLDMYIFKLMDASMSIGLILNSVLFYLGFFAMIVLMISIAKDRLTNSHVLVTIAIFVVAGLIVFIQSMGNGDWWRPFLYMGINILSVLPLLIYKSANKWTVYVIHMVYVPYVVYAYLSKVFLVVLPPYSSFRFRNVLFSLVDIFASIEVFRLIFAGVVLVFLVRHYSDRSELEMGYKEVETYE